MIFGEPMVRGVPAELHDERDATALENFSAAYQRQRLVGTIQSRTTRFQEAYDARNDAIFAATGERLFNPYRVTSQGLFDTLGWNQMGPMWFAEAEYERLRDELIERHPQHREIIRPPTGSVADAAAALAQQAEATHSNVQSRSDWLPWSAGLAGGFIGSMTDPINMIASLAGPMGRVGTGAAAVLWMGVRQGAANAGVEAAQAPIIQAWRREAGLDYGWSHAAGDVAMAAVGGFMIDAGIRGVSRTVRNYRGHVPLLDEAGGVTGWSPFVRDLASAMERMPPDQALDAAARGMGPNSLARQAADGDLDAMWRMIHATEQQHDPAMRGARAAAEIEREIATPMPAHVEEIDGFERLVQAARAAVDGEEPPPRGADPVPPAPPARADAPPADPNSPRVVLLEGRAGSSVEAARLLRADPSLLNAALPLSSHLTAQARSLARLSDEAFAAVEGGTIRANHAAIVGHLVEDRALHGEIVAAIAAAAPGNERQVRAIISDVLQAPRGQHHDVQRIMQGRGRIEPGLVGPRAKVLDQAVKLLEADARVFRAISKEAPRIEPVGVNRVDIDANVDRQLQAATVAAAIEQLAAAPGPVSRWLTEAARQVAEGRKPKAAAQEVADRVTAAIERDGMAALIEAPEPLLHPGRGIDEPAGAAALAQIEALEAQLSRKLELAQRELAEESVDRWVQWSRANGRAVPTLTSAERAAAVKAIQGGTAVADAVEAVLAKADAKAPEPVKDALGADTALKALDFAVVAGRTYEVKAPVIEAVHRALDPLRHMIPSDVTVATLARTEKAAKPGQVKAVFRTDDGTEFAVSGLWRDGFRDSIATAFPNLPGVGRAIVFWRLDLPEGAAHGLRGELWHELGHIYLTTIDDATRGLLVSHVNRLRVLDLPIGQLDLLMGRSDLGTSADARTIRELYGERYKQYSNTQTLVEEEGITHLLQLMHHGVLTPADIAPIKPLLDRMFGGELPGAPARPVPSNDNLPLFALAGRRAEHADLAALERAQTMDGEGADPVAIWRASGWYRGVDGEWRFEIDDAAARLHDEARNVVLNRDGAPVQLEMSAAEALQHQSLFEAYPFLGELRVSVRRRREGQGGRYIPEHGRIDVVAESASKARGILLEELQHVIQDAEQFAGGGNPHQMRLLTERAVAEIDTEAARVVEQLGAAGWMDRLTGEQGRLEARLAELKGLRQQWAEADYFQMYRALAGEVEARNVRTRSEMTAAGRRELAPWHTEDTPRDRQVVLRDSRAPRHAEEDWDSFQVADFLITQSTWADKAGKRAGRGPDPSQIERRAAKMAKDAAALERRRIGEGKTAADIAAEISRKFGAPVTADQVAKRMVWWNIDHLIKQRLPFSPELRDEMAKLYRAGVPLAEIAEHASRARGRKTTTVDVRKVLTRDGARKVGDIDSDLRWSRELGDEMAKMYRAGAPLTEIAEHASRARGREVSPASVYKMLTRNGVKREVDSGLVDLQTAAASAADRPPKRGAAGRREWPPDAVAVLASDEIRGMSWADVADLLRDRTGNEYSAMAVQSKVRNLRRALAEEQRLAEAKDLIEVCK